MQAGLTHRRAGRDKVVLVPAGLRITEATMYDGFERTQEISWWP